MERDREAFEQLVAEALDALPPEIARMLDNVSVHVEDEEPGHPERLGFYHGVPLTRRTSHYAGALPDRITIYRRPLERRCGADDELLRERVAHVVRHELAHHFGISDQRLRDIGRY